MVEAIGISRIDKAGPSRRHFGRAVDRSILLKLFINGNKRCHIPDTPTPAHKRNPIFKCKHHTTHDPGQSEKIAKQ